MYFSVACMSRLVLYGSADGSLSTGKAEQVQPQLPERSTEGACCALVASGGHQSCTVGLVLGVPVPCVPGFGMPCTCTQKLVLSLSESLSLLVIPGASCSRIPLVQSRPISHSYYKDGFYPKDGSCHKDGIYKRLSIMFMNFLRGQRFPSVP